MYAYNAQRPVYKCMCIRGDPLAICMCFVHETAGGDYDGEREEWSHNTQRMDLTEYV